MIRTSEWVSVAHPDRTADYIASKIITEIYKKDGKKAHAAIEVAIFGNKVIIGGEARTTIDLSPSSLAPIVKSAISEIGYDTNYRSKFSKEYCYIFEDYDIMVFINQQSPDIAKGTTDKVESEPGWNDQGTYVGYCSNELDTNGLSIPHYVASSFGEFLYKEALNSKVFGIDIKTLAVYEDDENCKNIKKITVAIPFINDESPNSMVLSIFEEWKQTQPESIKSLFKNGTEFLINGTGSYKMHGSICDSGLTGRKLVVNQCGNFAAGGSMIKPILASDRLLNLYARHLSLLICKTFNIKECQIELSASIGQTYLESINIITNELSNSEKELLKNYLTKIPVSPNILNKKWKTLERNNYDKAVFNNFFGSTNYDIEPWEEIDKTEIEGLKTIIPTTL